MRISRHLLAAAVLLAGCSITGSDDGEQLGSIQMLPEVPAQVTVPATAQRGEPFEVTVVTHAAGCASPGSTRVRTRGTTAEVRPYDSVSGTSCPYIGRYDHTATLRFDQPGPATVRIIGMGYPGPETVTIERTVTIQ
jgi:hypothetical protein